MNPRRLRSIRMQGGQGDVIMAVHGLQALNELGIESLAPDCIIYTRQMAAPVVRILLPEHRIETLESSRHSPHPRYAIVPHTSWSTVIRNWFYPDWYINFPERRLLASFGYPRPGLARRLQLFFTDLKVSGGTRWRRETPSYYALRIWAPLAEAWGLSETDLMRGLHSAHHTLQSRLEKHVAAHPVFPETGIPEISIFPSGKGFQYIPPTFLKSLIDRVDGRYRHACFFAPGDPSMDSYAGAGLTCRTTENMESLLAVVASTSVAVTCDSYVSHLAQLLARNHVALMSHDLPEHTVHPAAASTIVFEPLHCCPCAYTLRENSPVCQTGRAACGVYASERYLDTAVKAIQDAQAMASSRRTG